jgi:Ner family transcriptional regulator
MPIYTTPKKQPPQDWHRADIKAALEKAGWSLRRLGAAHGFSTQALNQALHRQWPNAERIIAEAIGHRPHQIWPSRYDAPGRPKRKRWDIPFARGAGRPEKGRFGGKHNSEANAVNVNPVGGNSHGAGAAKRDT